MTDANNNNQIQYFFYKVSQCSCCRQTFPYKRMCTYNIHFWILIATIFSFLHATMYCLDTCSKKTCSMYIRGNSISNNNNIIQIYNIIIDE